MVLLLHFAAAKHCMFRANGSSGLTCLRRPVRHFIMVRIPSGAQVVINQRFVTQEACDHLMQQLRQFLASAELRSTEQVLQEGGLHHRRVIKLE
jgi:hypothetical protein